MEYCSTAIFINNTLLAAEPPEHERSLRQEIEECEGQFETLLRLYYLRHSFEAADNWIVYFLTILGNQSCDKVNRGAALETLDPSTFNSFRSTLILCAKGLYDQGRSTHIASIVCHVLRDQMRKQDLLLLSSHANMTGLDIDDQAIMKQKVLSEWPVPSVGMNATTRREVSLGALMNKVEDLSLKAESSSEMRLNNT